MTGDVLAPAEVPEGCAPPADPEPQGPPSLRDRVLVAAGRVVGASERTHFLHLLRKARGYRLEAGAVAALARTVRAGLADVEANIDLVPLDGDGVWIEYPDAPRRLLGGDAVPGARQPHDVGVLVTVDPANTDRYVIMAAWDMEPAEAFSPDHAGSVRHGYAAVAISRLDAMHHAYAARIGHFTGGEAPYERLMGLFNPYIPDGLRDEMHLAAGAYDPDDQESLDRWAVRDVLAEVPFAICSLLLLSSLGRFGRGAEGSVGLPAPGRLDPVRRWWHGSGFRSVGRPDVERVRLAYMPPPEPTVRTVVA